MQRGSDNGAPEFEFPAHFCYECLAGASVQRYRSQRQHLRQVFFFYELLLDFFELYFYLQVKCSVRILQYGYP